MKVKEFITKNLNKKVPYKIDDFNYDNGVSIPKEILDKELRAWAINKYEGVIVIKTL